MLTLLAIGILAVWLWGRIMAGKILTQIKAASWTYLAPPTTHIYAKSETANICGNKPPPKHITVVLDPSAFDPATVAYKTHGVPQRDGIKRMMREVAKIACWCVSSGIFHLTIYDEQGILKSGAQNFPTAMRLVLRDYFAKEDLYQVASSTLSPQTITPQNHLLTHGVDDLEDSGISELDSGMGDSPVHSTMGDSEEEECAKPDATGKVNARTTVDIKQHSFNILNLSLGTVTLKIRFVGGPEAGKPQIASIAQQLAAQAVQKPHASISKSINVKLLNDMIDSDIPEPELMYICTPTGEPLNGKGSPVWQIRVTEIWHVGGDGLLRYDDFLNGLSKFSKCVQRLGK